MNKEQLPAATQKFLQAVEVFYNALDEATKNGVLDYIGAEVSPDVINAVCDRVTDLRHELNVKPRG